MDSIPDEGFDDRDEGHRWIDGAARVLGAATVPGNRRRDSCS